MAKGGKGGRGVAPPPAPEGDKRPAVAFVKPKPKMIKTREALYVGRGRNNAPVGLEDPMVRALVCVRLCCVACVCAGA